MKLKFMLCLQLLCLLSSCSLLQSTPTASIQLQSAHYLNPDIYSRSNPVRVTFYHLKSLHAFNGATYKQLEHAPSQVLTDSLLDMVVYTIRPNQHQTISLALTPGTKYIGVVAGFRDLAHAHWRRVLTIPVDSKSSTFTLTLSAQAINLAQEVS